MQKESVRSDQTRAHNDAGTSPSLTGRGIHAHVRVSCTCLPRGNSAIAANTACGAFAIAPPVCKRDWDCAGRRVS
eukprot:6950108-Prymnesium_polylepis.1